MALADLLEQYVRAEDAVQWKLTARSDDTFEFKYFFNEGSGLLIRIHDIDQAAYDALVAAFIADGKDTSTDGEVTVFGDLTLPTA